MTLVRPSAATGYAIEALVELAMGPADCTLPISVISERTGISGRFLEHIFRDLRRAGIVVSHRGGHNCGGYQLAVQPAALTLAAVARATTSPATTLADPTGRPVGCAVAQVWQQVEDLITVHLSRITVADLATPTCERDTPPPVDLVVESAAVGATSAATSWETL